MTRQPAELREHENNHLPGVCRDILTAPIALDRLLRPDFPAARKAPHGGPDRVEDEYDPVEEELRSIEAEPRSIEEEPDLELFPGVSGGAGRGRWGDLSRIRRIPPGEYRPKEVVPDEILTRQNADRGRPHPLKDRPAPQPDEDDPRQGNTRVWQLRDRLRECALCGSLFIPNRFNHRFCSRQCAWRSRVHVRVCPACGVEFIAERPEQVWCSVTCGASSRRTTEYDHVCVRCGTPYRATRASQRFCSRACSRALRQAQ